MGLENGLRINVVIESESAPERSLADECLEIMNERHNVSYGKKVVELGVGPGSMVNALMSKFGEKVCRMDITDWILRTRKIRRKEVKGEMQDLPIAPNSVDIMISAHPYDHLPDLRRMLEEVERVLVPGGEMMVVVPRLKHRRKKLESLINFLSIYGETEKLRDAWKQVDRERAERIWKRLELLSEDECAEAHLELADARMVARPEEDGHCWVLALRKKG